MGGRIRTDKNESVILIDDYPDFKGLNLTRSLGDHFAQKVGVIPDPDLSEYMVTKNDEMVIIASASVWDLISNERVSIIAHSFYESMQAEAAANAIL